jgi:hypothetical protein
MLLTKTKVDIAGALLIAALAIPLALQYRSGRKLSDENAGLREKTQQLTTLRRENEQLKRFQVDPGELARLRREHFELLKIRGEMDTLRRQANETTKLWADYTRLQTVVSNYEAMAEASQARLFVRLTEAKDVGASTPARLMQSWVWAMRTGDTNRVEALWDWPSEAPLAAKQRFLLQIAQATKDGEYVPTEPDAMMGFRVLDLKPAGNGDNDLVVENFTNQGSTRQQTVRIRHTGELWKVVIGKDGNLIETTTAPP